MQIKDLVKTIDEMTDEELMTRVREMRHRREVVRPAAKARVERVEKKASRAKVNKTADLLDNLSDEERLKLIELLSQGT
jgi:flagellar motility protein MotE (MotC chaperone)